ncbi:MAG TPA: glutathione peroxidase [Cryomorphaceae bacterium]|nr:glutathione peroxidase [Cryomorphaceae bacterium]HCY25274.1 glutathione peroxidase [Cryomorphaceae bacterium]|tara:strand:+ start:659 stop:1252 length:594 start_codon:yes stop_codon:yes gene_type:complete
MKYLLFTALLAACTGSSTGELANSTSNQTNEISIPMEKTSFHDLSATTIDGQIFDFSTLKGKRVLLVNVASKCGYTSQYEGLQELHATYGSDEFVIIGFPSNDFGGQEPGSELEIKSFCSKNYGVTFQMMGKVSTDGDNGHPVYQWLSNAAQNGVDDANVSWNFNKFLVDSEGNWVSHLGSRVRPMSKEVTNFAQGK